MRPLSANSSPTPATLSLPSPTYNLGQPQGQLVQAPTWAGESRTRRLDERAAQQPHHVVQEAVALCGDGHDASAAVAAIVLVAFRGEPSDLRACPRPLLTPRPPLAPRPLLRASSSAPAAATARVTPRLKNPRLHWLLLLLLLLLLLRWGAA